MRLNKLTVILLPFLLISCAGTISKALYGWEQRDRVQINGNAIFVGQTLDSVEEKAGPPTRTKTQVSDVGGAYDVKFKTSILWTYIQDAKEIRLTFDDGRLTYIFERNISD